MKFEEIQKIVKGVPFISVDHGRHLYDLIIREKPTNVLELGIAHGTGTCYMAAAMEENGKGTITSVDLIEAKVKFVPSPEEQLAKAGLQHYVKIVRMQTGYTWFLHDEISNLTKNNVCAQKYDLCIIDGPKNWTIDSCAFFLVDKILNDNGWIIFDDYGWTYADSVRAETDGITHRMLSDIERQTPHIREIFELLVQQHPNYSQFYRSPGDEWAIARKVRSDRKIYTIENRETFPTKTSEIFVRIKRLARKIVNKIYALKNA